MATSMSFELREKLEDTLKIAHEELQKAQQKGKHYYYYYDQRKNLSARR